MIELRWIRKAETTPKPDVLQYRSLQQVEGWTHSNWTEWLDVPVVLADAAKADSYGPQDGSVQPGGSVTLPVGLSGHHVWTEP